MFLHVPNHMVTIFEVTDEEKNSHWISCLKHAHTLAHSFTQTIRGLLALAELFIGKCFKQWHNHMPRVTNIGVRCSYVCMSMDVTYRCDKLTRHGKTKKKPNQKQKNIEIHSMGSFDGNRTTRVNGAWCHLSLFLDDDGIRARLTCFNVLYQLI